MKSIKTALVSLAAGGLVIAQPALAAADARVGSAVGESEELAGMASAAWPAVIAILLVGIVGLVSAESDNDNDDEPVSP